MKFEDLFILVNRKLQNKNKDEIIVFIGMIALHTLWILAKNGLISEKEVTEVVNSG